MVEIADRPVSGEVLAPIAPTMEQFLSGLRSAWQEGEVLTTCKPKEKARPVREHSWMRQDVHADCRAAAIGLVEAGWSCG